MHASSFKRCYPTPDFAGEFDFALYQEYSADGQHQFEDFMSRDCAWKQVVSQSWTSSVFIYLFCTDKIIIDHPKNKGAFFVPIIIGSDKMTVSVETGQTVYTYQSVIFATTYNIHIKTPSCFFVFLLAPNSSLLFFSSYLFQYYVDNNIYKDDPAFYNFQCQFIHSSLA